jgi:hypothetical protein
MCEISFGVQTFIGLLLALITFFAFPAFQYLVLKIFSRRHGKPELWYLPEFGFRLVIRNIPDKRTLSEIRSKTIIRNIIPPSTGASVATFQDETLIDKEDFFLFPGTDQILICFKILGNEQDKLKFSQTDKLGNILKEIPFSEFECVISDYVAKIENYLNFDVKIAKRVILTNVDFINFWNSIQVKNIETKFQCSEIIDVV